MLDQPFNIIGNQLFRADEYIHRQGFLRKQASMVQIFNRTYAGNLGWCMKQGVGHLAGHHIDLVAVGYSNKHIRVFGARLV